MFSDKNKRFLEAMTLVETFSDAVGTTSYIWGGFTLDVYNGRFLREHHDLDYLTENLVTVRSQLAELFESADWQAQKLTNGDLRCLKDDIRMHFGNIQISEKVAWTHNGKQGAIFFPIEWLKLTPILFYNVPVHVTEPEFECVIKHHPHLLNPDWKPRDKDIIAREQLRKMLAAKNKTVDDLYPLVTEWVPMRSQVKAG